MNKNAKVTSIILILMFAVFFIIFSTPEANPFVLIEIRVYVDSIGNLVSPIKRTATTDTINMGDGTMKDIIYPGVANVRNYLGEYATYETLTFFTKNSTTSFTNENTTEFSLIWIFDTDYNEVDFDFY